MRISPDERGSSVTPRVVNQPQIVSTPEPAPPAPRVSITRPGTGGSTAPRVPVTQIDIAPPAPQQVAAPQPVAPDPNLTAIQNAMGGNGAANACGGSTAQPGNGNGAACGGSAPATNNAPGGVPAATTSTQTPAQPQSTQTPAATVWSPQGAAHVLGSFKTGGKVPKTGVYQLHKGEVVLNTDTVKFIEKFAKNVLKQDKASKKKSKPKQ